MTTENGTLYGNETDCEIIMAFCSEKILNSSNTTLYKSKECK